MKNTSLKLLVLLYILLHNPIHAVNYYFSSSIGNDSNTAAQAQNTATPWKTLAKLNSAMPILLPGDSILFKCGDTFYGKLIVAASGNTTNPLVFSSYGNGPKPIITGLTTLNNWVNVGVNIWEANCLQAGTKINMLVINNQPYAMGRYPNYSDPNKGYLNFESHSTATVAPFTITDNQLTASPDWTGAELVIRTTRWIIERLKIVQHSASVITYSGPAHYEPQDNWGYFIQNSPLTLDLFGEWYYNPTTHNVRVFSGAANPNTLNIEVPTIDTLVFSNNQSYVVFNNIFFKGSNQTTIQLRTTQAFKLKNCDVYYSGVNGVILNGDNGNHNTLVENNTINYSNNIGFRNYEGYDFIFRNNVIKNTGTLPGVGQNFDDDYVGMLFAGKRNTIEYNKIDSSGSGHISFQGDSTLIKNNFLTNNDLCKDDAGAIHTWQGDACNGPGDPFRRIRKSKIIGNIILNGIGAGEGTNNPGVTYAEGIYLDDNSNDAEVIDNTVANMSNSGFFMHNAHEITAHGNTFFNNGGQQIYFAEGGCPLGLIRNNDFYNNILFAKLAHQKVLSLYSTQNDLQLFGQFDTNYYCRPIDEERAINANSNVENQINLAQWQSHYSKDLNSTITPTQIPKYSLTNLIGANKFSNSSFSVDVSGQYCIGSTCSTSWSNSVGLDGGALTFSFTAPTSTNSVSSLIINVGGIDATKKYILRFSLKGTKNDENISVFLRKATANYDYLTPLQYCKITTGRTENEFLFEPSQTETSGCIVFGIDGGDSTMFFDNIELYEANAIVTNVDNYIRFEYNETQIPKTINLSNAYIDVKNNFYAGSITLQPFTSAVLLKLPPAAQGIANHKLEQKNDLLVFPNPSSGIIYFQSENNTLDNISIYDVMGREVFNGSYSKKIDLSGLSNGVYLVKIKDKNAQTKTTTKIIIQQ